MEEVTKIQDGIVPYSLEDGEQRINDFVSAYERNSVENYENAKQDSLTAYDTARTNATENYANASRNIEDQYNISRNELKNQAFNNFVNTGLGSQHLLTFKAGMKSDLAKNNLARDTMMEDIDNAVANVETTYKNAINQVLLEGDYQKAQLIYSDWETGYDRDKAKAQTMAQYGDFSGYLDLGYTEDECVNMRAYYDALLQQQQLEQDLEKAATLAEYGDYSGYLKCGYTQEQVNNMTFSWSLSNPMMAYVLGYIDKATYNLMMERYNGITQDYNYSSSWYGGSSGSLPDDLAEAGYVEISFGGEAITAKTVQEFNDTMGGIRAAFNGGTWTTTVNGKKITYTSSTSMNYLGTDGKYHVKEEYEIYDKDGDGKITDNDYELNFLDSAMGTGNISGKVNSDNGINGTYSGTTSKVGEHTQNRNSGGVTNPTSQQNSTYTGPVNDGGTKHWWE